MSSLERSHRSLVREMRHALLSEIGARAIYHHLLRVVRDEDLAVVLERLNQEGVQLVEGVQVLIRELGGKPRRTSFRRRAMARGLALGARLSGPRPVLRICLNAEETLARWYSEYAHFLYRLGERERALTCERLSLAKQRRARVLGAWVHNLRRD